MAKKGIGWGGMSLKEMLAERDRLFEETGCYYGIKELELTETDPARLEQFHSRLLAAVIAGRESCKMVSGSPLVREVAELMTGLYTPEGECLVQSVGIAVHMPLIGQVVQWMIKENYEEEVGFNEGDIFSCNDNAIAGMHPADVYDIVPIFWEGELIAWVGTCIMELEVGAMSPGQVPSASTERFVDGMRISAEKTGEKDRLRKDFENRIRFGVRHPEPFLMDRKGAVAADLKVRAEVQKAIREFGVDYYKKAVRELIEVEHRAQLARVKARTVPGRYRSYLTEELYMSRLPVPPHHAKDQVVLAPIQGTIEPSGKYVLDFDGAGPWGWHASNCTPSALTAGLMYSLVQSIAYSGKANAGTLMATEMNFPYDTLVNPGSHLIATSTLWCGVNYGVSAWVGLQSRAFFSRGFLEEILAPAPATFFWEIGGIDHYGKYFGLGPGEIAGVTGGGARCTRDGLDGAYVIWNCEADAGNAELWEMLYPMLYLGRKFSVDLCGYGRQRSGYSISPIYLVYKTPLMCLDIPGNNAHEKIYPNTGMFGGYPAAGAYVTYVCDANTKELVEQRKPLVHELGDPRENDILKRIKGKHVTMGGSLNFAKDTLKDGDIWQVCFSGHGGGFGDPIKRDPALVLKDLDNGLATPEVCRRIYCVEAAYDVNTKKWVADEKKTKELRDEKKKERLERGITVKDWWQKRRQKLVNKELPPLMKEMYNGSLNKGEKWPEEFRAFWNLPQDFTF